MANYEGTKLQDLERVVDLDRLVNPQIMIVTGDNQFLITIEQLKYLLGIEQ